jgi:hypothetical protein
MMVLKFVTVGRGDQQKAKNVEEKNYRGASGS